MLGGWARCHANRVATGTPVASLRMSSGRPPVRSARRRLRPRHRRDPPCLLGDPAEPRFVEAALRVESVVQVENHAHADR